MAVDFLQIAFECKMASFQMDAVKALLCIEHDIVIGRDVLKGFQHDFPQSFREWIAINNPDAIFFSGPIKKVKYNTEYKEFL